jgi:hypothetical protein
MKPNGVMSAMISTRSCPVLTRSAMDTLARLVTVLEGIVFDAAA